MSHGTRRTILITAGSGLITLVLWARTGQAASSFPEWPRATPEQMGLDESRLIEARNYALSGGGAGYLVRGGKLVFSWGDVKEKFDLKSTTKSIGVTALGLAIQDGKMKLADKAHVYHPDLGLPPESNRKTGWLEKITLLHLVTQTAGFDKNGGYTALLFEPGTKWSYSDGGPNWLAECITLLYKRDVQEVMFERVFEPLGIQRSDLRWRENAYRPPEIKGIPRREFGSGIHANVDAMARIGYLYLRGGRWGDGLVIPRGFIGAAGIPVPQVEGLPVVKADMYPDASNHYGLLWWNNADGTLTNVPKDAYWSWGLHDSLIVVIPSLDLVVARAGSGWSDKRGSDYSKLRPFLEPIVASVRKKINYGVPPYPPSPVVREVTWADKDAVVRRADGSDNWPLTWADDDSLYTAYGDGWGFEPKVPIKLSLGFAKVIGSPNDFKAVNIRSPSGEQIGQGSQGKKASGLLMVGGTLYMWVRNAGNSQLAWSGDYGRTWTWSDWKFTTSFGCPTFLNFGKNYEGARDNYVYVYSHDSDSAYGPSNQMVLARVPKSSITDRSAYEFFQGLDSGGSPRWTEDVSQRKAVFTHRLNRCYRSGVSYNAALKRYMWCQIIPGADPRFEGGFGIYDAPDPWGPWTTAFFTERWDVGPGETCSIPTKWISPDGKSFHMVFSGNDMFSVRKGTIR